MKRLKFWSKNMDVLDKLVELAQVRGQADIQCQFRGDWYVRHEAQRGVALVHVATHGAGWLQVDDELAPRRLQAGDVVFFPRMAAHTLSSNRACNNVQDVPQTVQQGAFTLKYSGNNGNGESPDLNLFCALFEYDGQADLFNSLPETVCLDMRHTTALAALTDLLKSEANQAQSGSASVVNALSSVLLVLLVRAYMGQGGDLPGGVLKGWRDNRLRALVQAVLAAPEKSWPVEDMAALAHVSRAQLMRLFKQHLEVSPHAFVSRLRLQKAAMLLRTTQETVLGVALATGFLSETHFGKAFKKHYGVTPGQYRKKALAAG